MARRYAAPCLAISLLAAGACCSLAVAQSSFPTRPIKFLVPYPGGGTNDVLARIVGDRLQAKWGQPIIIENRSGGSGNIGAAAAGEGGRGGDTLLGSATTARPHN